MGYVSRLKKDLRRWHSEGWIQLEDEAALLADAGRQRGFASASGALAILGAVLLIMSAISFVAANWDGLSKIGRFALVNAALWASLFAAGQAFDRKNPVMGHALALVGAGLFGAGIILTAQTFNLTSFRNTAVLIWAASAFAIAWIIPSRPVLILAAILAAGWAGLEMANPAHRAIVWTYLPVWAAITWLAGQLGSKVTMNLNALALIVWISSSIFIVAVRSEYLVIDLEMILVLGFAALAIWFTLAEHRGMPGAGIHARWSAATMLCLGWAAQITLEFTNPDDLSDAPLVSGFALSQEALTGLALLVLMAGAVLLWRSGRIGLRALIALVISALIAAVIPALYAAADAGGRFWLALGYGSAFYAVSIVLILQGGRTGSRSLGVVGIIAFITQTLYVYGRTFGGLLDTALFFLVGGLILFGLSTLLLRLQRRAKPQTPAEETPA